MLRGFGKHQRLLDARDYNRVFREPAARVSNRHLLILAQPAVGGCARLGLVISRKNAGCAVKRNRIKRLCREAFRRRQHELPALDLVVLARPGISLLSNQQIHAALGELLTRLQDRYKLPGKPVGSASVAGTDADKKAQADQATQAPGNK